MGIRSEVGCLCTRELGEKILSAYTEAEKKEFFDEILKDEEEVLFHWDCVKWYDTPEVMKFESFLQTPEEFLFFRLGGDLSDAEEKGEFYDNKMHFGCIRKLTWERDL